MIFQQIKVGTSLNPHFHVILTGKIKFLYYFHDSRPPLASKDQFQRLILMGF